MKVTVSFGIGNDVQLESLPNGTSTETFNVTRRGASLFQRVYPTPANIGHVMTDKAIQAVLGFGDNVRPLVFSVEQTRATRLQDGMNLNIEDKPCEKRS